MDKFLELAQAARTSVIGNRPAKDGDCDVVSDALYDLLIEAGYDPGIVTGYYGGKKKLPNGLPFQGHAHFWVQVGDTYIDATHDQFKEPAIRIGKVSDKDFAKDYKANHMFSYPKKAGKTAHVRQDLVWLKSYLTMSRVDMGKELARNNAEDLVDFLENRDFKPPKKRKRQPSKPVQHELPSALPEDNPNDKYAWKVSETPSGFTLINNYGGTVATGKTRDELLHNWRDTVAQCYREADEERQHPQDFFDLIRDYDEDALAAIPDDLYEEFLEEGSNDAMRYDPANAPSFLFFSYEGVVKNQWLIHKTDDPDGICANGFTIGMDDLSRLGLTTEFKASGKRGGYNFAFTADYARHAEGKYGSDAVMFHASGLEVYHSGDEEHQVIFWGKDARDIIPIYHRGGDWCLPEDSNGKPVFYSERLQTVVDWVIQNFAQYRRTIVKKASGDPLKVTASVIEKIAANYEEMFKSWFKYIEDNHPETLSNLADQLKDGAPLEVEKKLPFEGAQFYFEEVQRNIKKRITWAKGVLKRSDRIICYLRWVRLSAIKTYTRELLQPELDSYSKKSGQRFTAESITPLYRLPEYQEAFSHYLSLPAPSIQNYEWGYQSLFQVVSDLEGLEDEWKKQNNRYLKPYDCDKIILQFPDRFAWWLLPRESCEDEARALVHCGNSGDPAPGDRILSLRNPCKEKGKEGYWEPHVTVILRKDGWISESKGRGNNKPSDKYHPYIVALLEKTDLVKGILGGGYKPENNFNVADLPEKQQEALGEKNPQLLPLKKYVEKFGVDESLLKRVFHGLNMKPAWDLASQNDYSFLGDRAHEVITHPSPGSTHYVTRMNRYQPDLKGLVVNFWADVNTFVKQMGDENARWVSEMLSGDGILDDDYNNVPWDDALANFDSAHVEMVGNFIAARYPDVVKEWESEQGWKFEPEDREFIKYIIRAKGEDLESVIDKLIDCGGQGAWVGMCDKMRKALNKALLECNHPMKGLRLVIPDDWNTPVFSVLDIMAACDLAQVGTDWDAYQDENDIIDGWRVRLQQPQYGFDGYDESAAQKLCEETFALPKEIEQHG